MAKYIKVVYENGVLKPLSSLKLKEHDRLKITLEEESVVKATSGMFSGLDDKTIDEIALSPQYSLEGS